MQRSSTFAASDGVLFVEFTKNHLLFCIGILKEVYK